jgi:hypothetical protein
MMDDMRYESANDDRERMIECIMECEGCSYAEAYAAVMWSGKPDDNQGEP